MQHKRSQNPQRRRYLLNVFFDWPSLPLDIQVYLLDARKFMYPCHSTSIRAMYLKELERCVPWPREKKMEAAIPPELFRHLMHLSYVDDEYMGYGKHVTIDLGYSVQARLEHWIADRFCWMQDCKVFTLLETASNEHGFCFLWDEDDWRCIMLSLYDMTIQLRAISKEEWSWQSSKARDFWAVCGSHAYAMDMREHKIESLVHTGEEDWKLWQEFAIAFGGSSRGGGLNADALYSIRNQLPVRNQFVVMHHPLPCAGMWVGLDELAAAIELVHASYGAEEEEEDERSRSRELKSVDVTVGDVPNDATANDVGLLFCKAAVAMAGLGFDGHFSSDVWLLQGPLDRSKFLYSNSIRRKDPNTECFMMCSVVMMTMRAAKKAIIQVKWHESDRSGWMNTYREGIWSAAGRDLYLDLKSEEEEEEKEE